MTDLENVEFVVRSIAQTAVAKEKEFGDLDAVVGDGDLGYSLARGFEKVLDEWDNLKRDSPATFLQQVAVIITSRIGGTSGPLWGTAFLKASAAAKGSDRVDGATVVAMLRAATDGIKARGNAELGDKTLLDAVVPATDALEKELANGTDAAGCLAVFSQTARTAADATSSLEARRGRASYSGKRSIGSPDAGAVAVAIMIERLTSEWAAR